MFKIGEFSKLTQVSIRMLRYYDETGLLKPAFIDPQTNYRMYFAEQIPRLNKIIYLRDSGFQVAEIKTALLSDNPAIITEQLAKKQEEILKNIQTEKEKLSKIKLANKEINAGKNDMYYNVSIRSIPSYRVLSFRKIIPNYYDEGKMWKEMSSFIKLHNLTVSNDTFSIYHDTEYKEENVDVEICAFTKETGTVTGQYRYRDTEPVSLMACTMVYGDFSNIAKAYLHFAGWLQQHSQFKLGSPSRQIVHRGPWNEEIPKNYVTEIQIPLKRTR